MIVGLSHGEVVEILKIIDEFGVGEFRLEFGDVRIHIVKGQPVALPSAEAVATPQLHTGGATVPDAVRPHHAHETHARSSAQTTGLARVVAPMIGTFYRAPAPDAAPFVELGQLVEADTPIGIVEVMKLMNTIAAGVRGRIREVCATNGSLVEYGQVLMLVDSSGAGE